MPLSTHRDSSESHPAPHKDIACYSSGLIPSTTSAWMYNYRLVPRLPLTCKTEHRAEIKSKSSHVLLHVREGGLGMRLITEHTLANMQATTILFSMSTVYLLRVHL
jgi:hypothetical protein